MPKDIRKLLENLSMFNAYVPDILMFFGNNDEIEDDCGMEAFIELNRTKLQNLYTLWLAVVDPNFD